MLPGKIQRYYQIIKEKFCYFFTTIPQKIHCLYQHYYPFFSAVIIRARDIQLKIQPKIQQWILEKIKWDELKEIAWVKQTQQAVRFGAHAASIMVTLSVNILAVVFPIMLMQIYDRVIPNRSYETLFFLSMLVVAALLLELTLRFSRSYLNLWSDTKYEYSLSQSAFRQLIYTPLPVFESAGAGKRLKQFSVLEQLKGFYNNQLLSSIVEVPFVFIFLLVIAYLDGWLFLIPLVAIIALGYSSFYFLQQSEVMINEKVEHESRENNFVIDVLSNIHTVKTLGMESLLIRRYERLESKGMVVNYTASVDAGKLVTLKMIANQIVVILLVAVGSLYVMHGSMTIGGLAACTLLVARMMQPMSRALAALNRWKIVNVVRQQFDALLALPVEAADAFSIGEFRGEIALTDVGFRHDAHSPWILQHIQFAAAPGCIIGITGFDQSGKTDLLMIIAGMLKPTTGHYTVDGVLVDRLFSDELREQIAYVSQMGKLFRGTVMENLSAFDQALIPAARALSDALALTPIIAKLQNGFDTMTGDRAVDSLPRGVIVRILIVRALVRNPKVILFDDASMNLDPYSEKQLMQLLLSYKNKATLIVASERASTLALADALYELKDTQLIKVK